MTFFFYFFGGQRKTPIISVIPRAFGEGCIFIRGCTHRVLSTHARQRVLIGVPWDAGTSTRKHAHTLGDHTPALGSGCVGDRIVHANDRRKARGVQVGVLGHVVRIKHAARQELVDVLPIADGSRTRRRPGFLGGHPRAQVRVWDETALEEIVAQRDGSMAAAEVAHKRPQAAGAVMSPFARHSGPSMVGAMVGAASSSVRASVTASKILRPPESTSAGCVNSRPRNFAGFCARIRTLIANSCNSLSVCARRLRNVRSCVRGSSGV